MKQSLLTMLQFWSQSQNNKKLLEKFSHRRVQIRHTLDLPSASMETALEEGGSGLVPISWEDFAMMREAEYCGSFDQCDGRGITKKWAGKRYFKIEINPIVGDRGNIHGGFQLYNQKKGGATEKGNCRTVQKEACLREIASFGVGHFGCGAPLSQTFAQRGQNQEWTAAGNTTCQELSLWSKQLKYWAWMIT